MRRTAVLVHVGTFGPADRSPELPSDLKYDSDVDQLKEQLRRYEFDVRELTGAELAGPAIWPAIKAVVDAHDRTDVVVVHIISHGYADETWLRLTVAGRDLIGPDGSISLAENADIVGWLGYLHRAESPYVLLLLDLCLAGSVVDADSALRIKEPNKLWILAAATRAAYDARFTRAVTAALHEINTTDASGARLRGFGPYVPLGTFAVHVTEKLAALTGTGYEQDMIGSRASITVNDALLPFFPNLSPADAPAPLSTDSFDKAPELAHFIAAVRCHGAGDGPSAFTGRTVEREAILGWLAGHRAGTVHLVTGRAGTGKSALLGAVVCATHPSIAPRLEQLGIDFLAAPATLIQPRAAVMSAHNKDLSALVAEIGRQLLGARDIRSADVLIGRLGAAEQPCLVVVDALDEAVDPMSVVDELIVPLARLAAPNVKILVSARPGEPTARLRDPATIDLNLTRRTDLEFYARTLLGTHPDYQGDEQAEDIRDRLAVTIARTLTNARTAPAIGEFLVTRLYVEWLLQRQRIAQNLDEAAEFGREVPLDLAELFEKDMQLLVDREWVRPVLTALAQDIGYGMPAQLIPPIVAVTIGRAPSDRDVAATLDSIGRYITVLPSPDGTAYRLFHDALAEHLREDSEPTLFEALLASVPRTNGRRDWARATWYARRHILRCAGNAATTLLLDTDYLLTPAPEIRTAIADLDTGDDSLVEAAGRVVDLATGWSQPLTEEQQSLLAVAAAKAGCTALAELLLPDTAGGLRPIFTAARATPRSRSDTRVSTELVAIAGEEPTSITRCPVSSSLKVGSSITLSEDLKVVTVESEIVTQDEQWRVEFRAITDPGTVHASLDLDGPVTAAIRADDTFVAAKWSGEIHDWGPGSWPEPSRLIEESIDELTYVTAAGEPWLIVRRKNSLAVLTRTTGSYPDMGRTLFDVGRHTVAELDGRLTIVFCLDSGETLLIDLSDCRLRHGLQRLQRPVTALATVPSRPQPVIALGDDDGQLWTWRYGTEEWQHLGSCDGPVTALATYRLNGVWFVGSATATGEVATWDLATRAADRIELGHPVKFLVNSVVEDAAALPVAVATGFGGVILAEPVDDVSLRTTWIPFDDNVPQTSTIALSAKVTGFWLAQHLGWSVLVVGCEDGQLLAFDPISGRLSLPITDQAVTAYPNRADQVVPVDGRLESVATHGTAAAWQHGATPLAVICDADRAMRIHTLGDASSPHSEVWLPSPARQVSVLPDSSGGYRIIVVTDDDIIVFALDGKDVGR